MSVPALKAERYYIYPLEGEPYEARFLWGDNLRAELEGAKRGVSRAAASPFLFLSLTAWAEAVRMGRTTDKYDAWVAGIEAIDDASKRDKRDGQPVDDEDTTGDPT